MNKFLETGQTGHNGLRLIKNSNNKNVILKVKKWILINKFKNKHFPLGVPEDSPWL